MSADLLQQLRAYGEDFEASSKPLSVDQVRSERFGPRPVRVLAPGPLGRQLPGWVYGVAAAVLVLVLVGGVALLVTLVGERGSPVVTEPEPLPPTTVPEAPPPESAGDRVVAETSMGTWVWTRHDGPVAELDELWGELRSDGPALFANPEVPFPEIEGLTWHDHGPADRFARLGEVTVAAVSIGGEVDWGAVYGYPAAARWRPDLPRTLSVTCPIWASFSSSMDTPPACATVFTPIYEYCKIRMLACRRADRRSRRRARRCSWPSKRRYPTSRR